MAYRDLPVFRVEASYLHSYNCCVTELKMSAGSQHRYDFAACGVAVLARLRGQTAVLLNVYT